MTTLPFWVDALPPWVAVPVALLLILSGVLTVTGALGLLRFDHFYARVHAPTLGNTMGVFCLLIASILVATTVQGRPIVHELIITALLVITSPVATMLLMRAAIGRIERDEREGASGNTNC